MKDMQAVFNGFFLWVLILQFGICSAQTELIFEAEDGKLSGEANIVVCSRASGGEMVRGISSGIANALAFEEINVSETREYFITLTYLTPSERTFTYELNEKNPKSHDILASGAWCYQGGGTRDFIFQEREDMH